MVFVGAWCQPSRRISYQAVGGRTLIEIVLCVTAHVTIALSMSQASWHPHSEEHLVVLTSDNRVRLYRVTHSLAIAEQTLHVILSTGALPQRYGLGAASGSPGPGGTAGEAQASGDVVAFAFGPSVGWGIFALLLLAVDGQVYVLGPVAPFGLRCTSALLERLSQETAAAAEWLEAVFGSDAVQDPSSKNRWQGKMVGVLVACKLGIYDSCVKCKKNAWHAAR